MLKRFILIFFGLTLGLVLWQGQTQAQAMPANSPETSEVPNVSSMRQYRRSMPVLNFASTSSNRFKQSWPWYVTRASGILAAILLAVLVVSGVGLLTGYTYRILEPLPAWVVHRAIGLAFGAMVLVHMGVLVFDKYVGFDILDVLVPFRSQYQPVTIGGLRLGPIYMVCGILAFYGITVITITSLLWMQKKPKLWHFIHYGSYAVLLLVFMHGLFLGTDMKQAFAKVLWLLTAFVVLASIATRLRRARTIGKGGK